MTTFRFIFNGEIKKGYTIAQVRKNLAHCFATSENNLKLIFDGKASFLKTALNKDIAQQYINLFDKEGAISHIEAEDNTARMIQCPECLLLQEKNKQCSKCVAPFYSNKIQQNSSYKQSSTTRQTLKSSSGNNSTIKANDQNTINSAQLIFDKNKKVNKNAVSVQSFISIAVTLLIATFFIDNILSNNFLDMNFWLFGESAAVDIGYLPYIFSLTFFAFAGMNYAHTKGYPRILGAVLGFSGFGLALLTILPDKYSADNKFKLNIQVFIAVGVICFGIIWLFSLNSSNQEVIEFKQMVNNNKEYYHFYPSDDLMDETELKDLNDLSISMIENGFKLLTDFSLRSSDQAQIMNSMLRIIAWQMMSFNTQRVYYAQDNGMFPYYLSDDYKKDLISQFNSLMNTHTNELGDFNLSTIASDWVYTQRSEKAEMISTAFARLRGHLLEERHRKHMSKFYQKTDSGHYADVQTNSYNMHSSVELSEFLDSIALPTAIESVTELEPGIMSIKLKQEYTGSTLIIAYYHHEYFDPKSNQREDKVSIARIGGDIDNKYIYYGEYSAFFGWPISYN